jgi:hypothetical protein
LLRKIRVDAGADAVMDEEQPERQPAASYMAGV